MEIGLEPIGRQGLTLVKFGLVIHVSLLAADQEPAREDGIGHEARILRICGD